MECVEENNIINVSLITPLKQSQKKVKFPWVSEKHHLQIYKIDP